MRERLGAGSSVSSGPSFRSRVASPSALAGLVVLAGAVASACSSSTDGTQGSEDQEDALTAIRAACTVPTIDPAESLFITDQAVLADSRFTMTSVLKSILASGNSTQTPAQFGQQLAGAFDTKAGDVNHVVGPHCDDHVNASGQDTINGFPIDCPREEYDLVGASDLVAVVNRFDLAPASGANCGEYRLIFAAPAGDISDHFWNFEGVLPNPDPAGGIDSCAPVVDFWANLSASNTQGKALASALETFFFTGLPGFEPVIKATHYGIGGGTNTGQIRTNTLKGSQAPPPAPPTQDWQLREFRLTSTCTSATSCKLIAEPSAVANNPYVGLFAAAGAGSTLTSFQSLFVKTMAPLVETDSPALIALALMPAYDAGQSNSDTNPNDYGAAPISASFKAAITKQLKALGRSDLTPQNVLDRATTQSCGGCHNVSNNKPLGGPSKPVWPSSLGFMQVNEDSSLSPALTQVFLPHRAEVMTTFLKAQCPGAIGTPVSPDGTRTIGGSVVGAAD